MWTIDSGGNAENTPALEPCELRSLEPSALRRHDSQTATVALDLDRHASFQHLVEHPIDVRA
jgi:hypothetical protein